MALTTRDIVANGGGLVRAIDDSLKRWPALAHYAPSAILPIGKNAVENVIRPIALIEEIWLFTGPECSGRSATAIQGLLAPPPNSTTSTSRPSLKTR